MKSPRKTAIVTGASQGIGAGIAREFVERDFNVVANSRKVTESTEVAASGHVALVDGHIGEPATAARIVETALSRFKSIDALVNNAGIFFTRPFTDYTADDFKALVSTNLEGFLYVTQLCIRQMLAQKTGGSIVTITAALARNPIRGVTAAVPMMTKGGLETITQHLAMEWRRRGRAMSGTIPTSIATTRIWTDEFAFLSQPGQADIQSDLFYDYRTNVDAYPKWQAWMREKQPRLLVLWGRYDLSFDISEPEAYRRDVPKAEVHVLDAGHFALDTAADQVAQLVRGFMK